MSTSGQDDTRHQIFLGPASFGGDNNGVINNFLLDPKTKAMLAAFAEKAPEFAALLERSLRDGFISADTAQALLFAARNINEDVAQALLVAGRNINQDVADRLFHSGLQIQEAIDERLPLVNRQLSESIDEINSAAESMRMMFEQSSSRAETFPVQVREGRVPFGSQNIDSWRFRLGLMCGSSAAGLVAAIILERNRLGGQAIFVAVAMVGLAVAFLVKRRASKVFK